MTASSHKVTLAQSDVPAQRDDAVLPLTGPGKVPTLEEMVRAVADLSPTLTAPKAEIPWTRVLGENPQRLPVAVG